MKKEKINIAYVDDKLDRKISEFLNNYFYNLLEINVEEIEFTETDTYESLQKKLIDENINLLIIDSALYLLNDDRDKRFSGEEIKIILKRFHPYIETIVISQNESKESYDIVSKYNIDKHSDTYKEPIKYYESVLGNIIEKKINEILMGREIFQKLDEKNGLEKVLIEKISLSLENNDEYSELTKEDIEVLINEFKELKETITKKDKNE